MPAPKSGNGGTLSIEAQTTYDIRSWSLSKVADNQAFVSSQTAGKTHRVKGNIDMSMNISLFAPDGAIELGAGIEIGEEVDIIATTDGVNSFTGPIIIDSMEIVVNIEAGENIGIDIVGSGVSALSYP